MISKHYIFFRIFTSIIFLYAGAGHLLNKEKILLKLSATQFYTLLPDKLILTALIYISGMVMIVAGIMLALGFKEKLAATALFLVLIPITITVQTENIKDLGPFFKNVAIAGSLLFIIYNKKQYENKNAGIICSSVIN